MFVPYLCASVKYLSFLSQPLIGCDGMWWLFDTIFVFICLSLSFSVFLCLSLSFSVFLYLYLSLSFSVFLSLSFFIFCYLPLSSFIFLYLPLSSFISTILLLLKIIIKNWNKIYITIYYINKNINLLSRCICI